MLGYDRFMKRPFLVTLIGVFSIIGGIAQAVFGAVLLSLRNDQVFLADADIESDLATTIAIACMVVGVLAVVFAIGLLKGNRLARLLLGASQVAQIGLSVYALVELDAERRPGAIGNILTALVVLYFVFGTDKAKAFFARR